MTLAMATFGLYSFIATLLWGRVLFGIEISLADPVAFALAAVVLSVGVGMAGFVLAMAAVRYRSAWALGAGIDVPIFLVCGFVVPLALLPSWVTPISWLLPPTWGAIAARDAAAGGNPWPDIAMCLLVSAIYCVIGTLLADRLLNSARTHATLSLS
jgi:ABC-2 type transport system permease protein